ncbi:AAA family ATPase [Cystobacter fuscus]
MPTPLLELSVKNYKSLRDVSVRLGPLNVLVGPNGSGKSNLLDVIEFLGDSAREDLGPALERHLGYHRIYFRGETSGPIRIHVKAMVTSYAHEGAPDEYKLSIKGSTLRARIKQTHPSQWTAGAPKLLLQRQEEFAFKRVRGRGRRITISGGKSELVDLRGDKEEKRKRGISLRSDSLGLSTLPKLAPEEGGEGVRKMAELFSTFRVFDVDARAARQPSASPIERVLQSDASNLAAFLRYLSENEETFEQLQDDARAMVPGLQHIHLRPIGGATEAVAIELEEAGLKGRTSLAEASFGTIRALALLAMLYDPNPPQLTCVEEIDHGFHPYVLDRLVDRLRWASQRTQFLIATHSPTLVNRLHANELIVCERNPETGESLIPAADPEDVRAMEERAQGRMGLGELWFTGSLGGVPR